VSARCSHALHVPLSESQFLTLTLTAEAMDVVLLWWEPEAPGPQRWRCGGTPPTGLEPRWVRRACCRGPVWSIQLLREGAVVAVIVPDQTHPRLWDVARYGLSERAAAVH
jgi:hypothetical protein